MTWPSLAISPDIVIPQADSASGTSWIFPITSLQTPGYPAGDLQPLAMLQDTGALGSSAVSGGMAYFDIRGGGAGDSWDVEEGMGDDD